MWVDKNHLVVLVFAVLPDPVGIEYLEVGVPFRSPLLSYPLDVLGHGDLLDAGLAFKMVGFINITRDKKTIVTNNAQIFFLITPSQVSRKKVSFFM